MNYYKRFTTHSPYGFPLTRPLVPIASEDIDSDATEALRRSAEARGVVLIPEELDRYGCWIMAPTEEAWSMLVAQNEPAGVAAVVQKASKKRTFSAHMSHLPTHSRDGEPLLAPMLAFQLDAACGLSGMGDLIESLRRDRITVLLGGSAPGWLAFSPTAEAWAELVAANAAKGNPK